MKITSDVIEYAWLINETGCNFSQIYQYIHAQDYYFIMLDDDESPDAEAMFDCIYHSTHLTLKLIKKLGAAQLKLDQIELSDLEMDHLAEKMYKSLTAKDRKLISPEFMEELYNYLPQS